MSIPHLFKCPISLELFTDPVTLCTGQTYDRPCIEKWLGAGNLTCPVSMQKLSDLSLVPNHTLRHLIDQWVQMVHHHDQIIGDLDDHHDFDQVGCSNVSFHTLKQTLESKDSIFEQKIQALEQVRCLSNDLPNKSEGLIQLGFFPLLLGLVFEAKFSQEMIVLVEKALGCVIKLMGFCDLSHLNILLEESKFENFIILLQQGTSMVKISLCNVIEVIFFPSSLETQELAFKIGNETKVLKSLITYLDEYEYNPEVPEAGIKAILGMLSSSKGAYRENLIKQGLVHSLVTYILQVEKQEKNLAPKATKALEFLLELQSGKDVFLMNEVPNGVKALIKMVFRVSGDEEGSESAVNSLMLLCCESKEVKEGVICEGILTQLLLLLQSQCSVRAKTRARMLLKLLRTMWVKDPKHVL